jgi:hypothetical protein
MQYLGVRWFGLLLSFALVLSVLVLPGFAADDKKDKKAPPKEKLLPGKTIPQAKIRGVNADQRTITIEVGNQSAEVVATENAYVRTKAIPSAFDDKGNIVTKVSPEKEKELKGDTPAEQKMKGYKAAFSDLRPNQIVEITLHKLATTPGIKKKDEKPDTRLRATFIMVLQEPQQ